MCCLYCFNPFNKFIKFSVSIFNEIIIFFYILVVYYLVSIDNSELDDKFDVGKILFFIGIVQKLGNSMILVLMILVKVQMIVQKFKKHKYQNIS